MNSKFTELQGTSKATGIIKELKRALRENRIQPGRNVRISRGPGGTLITAKPQSTGSQGGEAVWL